MFTGIVQGIAEVTEIQEQQQLKTLTVKGEDKLVYRLERGASVAINGVCLTATDFNQHEGWIKFDVIAETLDKTNLGKLQLGSLVNFERSLTFGSEIGGHIVSGHIQTTALLQQVNKTDTNCMLRLQIASEFMPYILPKGFVAVEGCSLTVGECYEDGFSLHLIPETLALTTLGQKQPGEQLNIELDQQTVTIVRTVERIMAQRS